MKTIVATFLFAVMLGASSCTIVAIRDPNGRPIGWHKNTNNPHHPYTTNPGHTKGHPGAVGKPQK